MFDDELIDSEDELVAGENNYIEIDCLPIEKKPSPPLANEEEKKKEDSNPSSSKYKASEDGEKNAGEDGGGISA